jgi:hypothetical protein
VVSGRVISWVALLGVVVAAGGPVWAEPPPPADPAGLPPTRYPLPTDGLVTPAPPVPPRTAYQVPRQPGGVPDQPDFTLPDGSVIPVPRGKARQFRFTRRYGVPIFLDRTTLPDGSERWVFTGGVIVNVTAENGKDEIEFATDDAVVWIKGKSFTSITNGFQTSGDGKTEVEVYLSGNVIVRTLSKEGVPQTLRAAQVYYDVERERAVALAADLELAPKNIPDPLHLRGEEVRRLDTENWEALQASFSSSKLPSDPGVRIDSERVTFSEREVRLRNVFGIPYRELLTGEPVYGREQLVTAYGAVPKLAGVPVMYFPRVTTDATDPLGPFVGFGFGQNRIFGTQFYTTWDVFDLLAIKPPPGQKWRLNLDYLSQRGPGVGTDYLYRLAPASPDLSPTEGLVKLYGVYDQGVDILGGNRGPQPVPQLGRGRALWRHQQEILQGLYFQGQVAYQSDQNFFEQYYKQEFDLGPNQETFAYLTWNYRQFWAAGLVEDRMFRNWIGETNWLPRVDGAIIGQSFFDLFIYNARANAAYAQLRPGEQNPLPLLTTDQKLNTGRIDLLQELSVPFALGPVKLAPYGVLDLAGYSEDLTGNSAGRIWGGGGARGSLPLSRLYADATSDLFNVRGLYHKIVLGSNFLFAESNLPYTQLPYLDRLNDDATDQAWRNMTPFQPLYVSGPNGVLLSNAPDPTSPFNPQRYAIRRLVTNKPDTLDSISVLQLDARQRLQTKRGYPGLEHTVDLVTLGTSVSYFPNASRDNFGNPFAFLEYDFLWNVGDRMALASTGWFEPYDDGSRYYTIGSFFNRPNGNMLYLGYRQIDPINSRAVIGTVGYQLSRRYYLNAAVSYDFGINQALSNSVTLTRTGTDLTISIGFTYNSLVNNFGFQFLITPNVLTALTGGRFAGMPLQNPNASMGPQR